MKRDLYKLLGVERDATAEDIKRAYRKLAFQYHPDKVGDDPDKIQLFKDIADAYRILSDSAERDAYDMRGSAAPKVGDVDLSDIFDEFADIFNGYGTKTLGARHTHGASRAGANIHVDIFPTVKQLYLGEQIEVTYNRLDICTDCDGQGAKEEDISKCPDCKGKGIQEKVSRTILGEVRAKHDCKGCGGDGVLITKSCRKCNGEGRSIVECKHKVSVTDKNYEDHITIGELGHRGIRTPEYGSLVIHIEKPEIDEYRKSEFNAYYSLILSYPKVILGCTVSIPLLDGTYKEFIVEPCAKPGVIGRIVGGGFKNPYDNRIGDLYVEMSIYVPDEIEAGDKEILWNMELHNTFNPQIKTKLLT